MDKLDQIITIQDEESKFGLAALQDLIKCGWVIEKWDSYKKRDTYYTDVTIVKYIKCE